MVVLGVGRLPHRGSVILLSRNGLIAELLVFTILTIPLPVALELFGHTVAIKANHRAFAAMVQVVASQLVLKVDDFQPRSSSFRADRYREPKVS